MAGTLWPDRAIGFTGFRISQDAAGRDITHCNESCPEVGIMQDVHVLEGYRGVLYRRRFFEQDIYTHMEKGSQLFRMHDDILLSGYLASRGIPRSVVWYGDGTTAAKPPWELLGDGIGLHADDVFVQRGWAAIDYWQRGGLRPFGSIGVTDPAERLQLNAGVKPRVGFLHHATVDSTSGSAMLHDLRVLPWPWQDQQFQDILFVHSGAAMLPPVATWLPECRRLLKADGVLYLLGSHSLERQLALAISDDRPVATLGRPPDGLHAGNCDVWVSSGNCGGYWRAACQRIGEGVAALLVRSQPPTARRNYIADTPSRADTD
jgi:hypothetical protein